MGLTRISGRGGGLVLVIDGKTLTITPTQMALHTQATLRVELARQFGAPLPQTIFLHRNRDGKNEITYGPSSTRPSVRIEDEPETTRQRR